MRDRDPLVVACYLVVDLDRLQRCVAWSSLDIFWSRMEILRVAAETTS